MKTLCKSLTLALIVMLGSTSMAASTQSGENKELKELKVKLHAEIQESSCLSSLPIANQVYALDDKYVPALQTIVKCTVAEQNVSQYATETKEIFERSKILSIIP